MGLLKLTFEDLYKPYVWRGKIFNLSVVGVYLYEPIHKEGYVYQEIRLNGGVYRFLYTEMPRLFVFSKKLMWKRIEEKFSFISEVRTDFDTLRIFDKPLKLPICYPIEEDRGEEGVYFKLVDGRTLFFPLEGKRIPSDIAFTLLHPLPPAVLFF
ncbi:MAG: hypothetical protein QW251_00865 [Desulfurococcaceae archaeon]